MYWREIFFILVVLFIIYADQIFTFDNVEPLVELSNLESVVQIKKSIGIIYFDSKEEAMDWSKKFQVLFNTKTNLRLCEVLKDIYVSNKDMIYNTNDIMGCGYGPKFIKKYLIDKPYIFLAPYEWFVKNNLTEKLGLIILVVNPGQARLIMWAYEDFGKKFNVDIGRHRACGLENIFSKKNHPWITKSCPRLNMPDEIWIGLTHQEMGIIYNQLKDIQKSTTI